MRIRHSISGLASAALVVAALAAVSCVPAQADLLRKKVSSFGVLAFPTGVAVDQSNGNVFVVDGGGPEVVKIFGPSGGAPSGGVPAEITGSETAHKKFVFSSEPAGVAIDNSSGPSKGAVYVTDTVDSVVDEFKLNQSQEYKLVHEFTGLGSEPVGVVVDANGNVYIALYGNTVLKYGSSGQLLRAVGANSAFSNPYIGGIGTFAVDGQGSLYLQEWKSNLEGRLNEYKLDSSGNVVEGIALFPGGVTSLTFGSSGESRFINFGSEIWATEPQGDTKFGAGEIAKSYGIALNESSGDVYVSNASAGAVSRLSPTVVIPDVAGASKPAYATQVVASQAKAVVTLAGTVNPDSTSVTTCRFQIGSSSLYGQTIPCNQTLPLTGSSGTTVNAEASLLPNATYHYRLEAANSNGLNEGKDITFSTSTPPSVNEKPATASSITSDGQALIGGVINPMRLPTEYYVAYGTTASYGMRTPNEPEAGSGVEDIPVNQKLEGLQPETTYHYAIVATNAVGTSVTSDRTFTTPPATPPIVTTGEAAGVTHATANVAGTVDPNGLPTMYQFEYGTTTAYGTSVFGDAGASAGAESVSIQLRGLAFASTYHYRLVAINKDGTAYGEDRTLTTLPFPEVFGVPAAPPLISATAIAFPTEASGTPTHKKASRRKSHKKAKHPSKRKRKKKK